MTRSSRRRLLAATIIPTTVFSLATATPAAAQAATSWAADLCYQLVTDRFADGNAGNNNPAKSPGLYDASRTNWRLYWGGDFAGITDRLDYLAGLGVTAIWISPHVDNIDVAATYGGVPNAGYHGYWARDFFRTEEHFGSLAEFDSLVAAAHAAGIKVIMDWAPNHTSPADPDAGLYLNIAMRQVFGQGGSMTTLDAAIAATGADYDYPENLITFVDNHDMSRFLTLQPDQGRLHQALAFMMTVRGTPCLYYGTEQYLHNDTDGGGDPFNRPMMPGFGTGTTAYQLISELSALRRSQPALAWGTHQQRWINDDVYIYERRFFDDVVLVAINKGGTSQPVSGLLTALPPGSHGDQLGGLLGGGGITVGSGSGGNNPVGNFTLGAGQVAVWSHVAAGPVAPRIGSAAPVLTRAGNPITVQGRGFGGSGTLRVGGVAAPVTSWSADRIVAAVPAGVAAGVRPVTVTTGGGTSNGYELRVLSGPQVPVTFTVNDAIPTNFGDNIYLTGSVAELGNWSTDPDVAIGPMLTPHHPDWFIVASVPACATVQFKFVRITASGAVTWENGPNHSYTAPCSGTDAVTVNWQN